MIKLILLFCTFQQSNIVPLKSFNVTEFPSKSSEPVDYVIITIDELVPAYEALSEWKTSKGVNCIIKTVSWIVQNYPGSDTPEKMRNFIKSAYSDWNTRWVLLGGDPKIVPTRLAASRNGGYSPYYLIAADIYYSTLNGTWNDDGDFLWGESSADNVDFTPFVYVGRLPGSTPEEANKVISKIIEYEKTPFVDCLERALFLTFTEEVGGVRAVMKYFPDYFVKDTLWDASKSTILEYMSKGYGFVYGAFHGSSNQYWSRGGGNISRVDIDKLNIPLYSINAISCHTHQIELDCLSRHCMFYPSISCIGSSRVGWFSAETGVNSSYYVAVFDSLFPAGKALAYAKSKIISQSQTDGECRDVMLSYDLYGDPTLNFWTRKPVKLEVSYPLSIMPGEKQIKVVVKSNNIPIPGATVCIYRKGESYGRGYTNTQGELIFSIVSETRGDLKIVATKTDFLPYEGYIFVQPEYAYLKYKSYAITKSAEPGKDIAMSISVENTGAIKAFDVIAKLKTGSLYVTLLDTIRQYGNFSSGEIKSQNYGIKINNACPDTNINFELLVYSASDSSKDTFNLPVYAPMLSHYSHYIDSLGRVSVKIKNSGTGNAKDVTATLSSVTAGVFITDSTEYLGNIQGGIKSFEDCFSFNTSASNPVFVLNMKDSVSKVWVDTFIYKTITPPSGLYTSARASGILVGWAPAYNAYGYNVYRMPDSVLINSYPATKVYSCEDRGVTPFSDYSYCVTSLDASLNESNFSQSVSGRRNPALKPGWPKRGKGAFTTPPGIADLIPGAAGLEVITSCDMDETLYGWYASGEGILSGDGAFTANLGSSWTVPIIADIDGDGEFEIVRTESWVGNPRVWVLNKDGGICPNFPIILTGCVGYQCFSSPSVRDLDGDGKLEIIIPAGAADKSARLYIFREDGSGFSSPDGIFAKVDSSSIGVIGSTVGMTPAISDINNDSILEIIAGFSGKLYVWEPSGAPVAGWPVSLNGIPSSPSVGDIDTSYSGLEVVVHTSGNIVYVFHSDGSLVSGWPRNCVTSAALMSSPSLGDIDGDGILEIGLGGTNSFYLWRWNGAAVSGWPISMPLMDAVCPVYPLLADVDGDGKIEYIGTSLYDGNIYSFEADGKVTPGFPITANGMIQATPIIIDMDADGKNELVAGTWDYNLNIWDIEGSKVEWGGLGHNRWHTGEYGFVPYDTVKAGVEEQLPVNSKQLAVKAEPNPFFQSTVISYQVPVLSKISLRIYDISGRVVRTLVDGKIKSGNHSIKWEGFDNTGRKAACGVYFYRFEADKQKLTGKLVLLR